MLQSKLFSLIFFCGLANAMIRPIRLHIEEFALLDAALNGFGISFIIWLAAYTSLNLLQRSNTQIANRRDWIMSVVTMLLLIIPSAFTSWIALSFFAAYCGFFAFDKRTAGRNAAFIMLAIALRVPLSDMCLKIFADGLLQLDALLTLGLANVMEPEISRQSNIIIGKDGHELLIMTGCASFTNISLAVLLWFTILRSQILQWHRRLTVYVIPLCLCVMGVNIARLSMMSLSHEDYVFYHDGLGADIVNALILLIALGVALLSLHLEKRKNQEARHAT